MLDTHYGSFGNLIIYLFSGGLDLSNVWNDVIIIVAIVGAFVILRSGIGQKLAEALGGLATARKEAVDEKDAEIAKMKVELRRTTQELRQAREFGDEDRVIIRGLRNRCHRYLIEINQHRLGKSIPPILAGSEDDDRNLPTVL
jgi:hypothetical protein